MGLSAVDAAPEMGLAQPGMGGQTALSSLAGRAIGGTATRAAVGQGYRVPGAGAADEIATTATLILLPPSAEKGGSAMVFDFAAQPPELISAKIYSGPGTESLQAAAAAWDGLSSELQSTAANY